MEHIAGHLQKIERNMKLNSADPIALHGFTQLPNFILRNPEIPSAPRPYTRLLLSYAWHNNLCFPGQDRLAEHMGMGMSSVNRSIKELEDCSLIEIDAAGKARPTSTPSTSW